MIPYSKEIRDSAETAFPNLVADMNAVEDIYDFHVGARQGSSSSKEQEGFVWDRTKFAMHDAYDFVDTDQFKPIKKKKFENFKNF